MIDPEHAHVGAAPLTALLDGFRGGVENSGKAQWTRGYALGRLDRRVLRPQAGEGITSAAAGLVH